MFLNSCGSLRSGCPQVEENEGVEMRRQMFKPTGCIGAVVAVREAFYTMQ
jgi:hypothetical protein